MKKLKNIIITGVLLIVFVFSAYKITTKFYTDIRAESTYSSLKAKNEKRDTDDGEDLKEDLSNLNKDFKFWITIDNTDVEYPVLQAKDNDYYLKRDINKKSTAAGSISLPVILASPSVRILLASSRLILNCIWRSKIVRFS